MTLSRSVGNSHSDHQRENCCFPNWHKGKVTLWKGQHFIIIETKSQEVLQLSPRNSCILWSWGKTRATVISTDDGSTAQWTDSLTGIATVTRRRSMTWVGSLKKSWILPPLRRTVTNTTPFSFDLLLPKRSLALVAKCGCLLSSLKDVIWFKKNKKQKQNPEFKSWKIWKWTQLSTQEVLFKHFYFMCYWHPVERCAERSIQHDTKIMRRQLNIQIG